MRFCFPWPGKRSNSGKVFPRAWRRPFRNCWTRCVRWLPNADLSCIPRRLQRERDEATGGAHPQEDAKLSVLDVCRLSHFRLQLDHLAIHSEPAVSVMVDGLGILLRRIDPGLEHFKDEEIVLV